METLQIIKRKNKVIVSAKIIASALRTMKVIRRILVNKEKTKIREAAVLLVFIDG